MRSCSWLAQRGPVSSLPCHQGLPIRPDHFLKENAYAPLSTSIQAPRSIYEQRPVPLIKRLGLTWIQRIGRSVSQWRRQSVPYYSRASFFLVVPFIN